MKIYKIKNKDTGLFAATINRWNKRGKTWKYYPKDMILYLSSSDINWELVVFELSDTVKIESKDWSFITEVECRHICSLVEECSLVEGSYLEFNYQPDTEDFAEKIEISVSSIEKGHRFTASIVIFKSGNIFIHEVDRSDRHCYTPINTVKIIDYLRSQGFQFN